MNKTILFIISFAFLSVGHSAEEEAQGSIRMIFCPGIWKTGTSTLDALMKRNKEVFEKQGIYYPDDIHDWTDSEYYHRGGRPSKPYDDDFFRKFATQVRKKKCTTVFWLNENFFDMEGNEVPVSYMNELHKKMTKHFKIEVMITVREFYTWMWSMYTQSRKMGREFRSFKERAEKYTIHHFRIGQALGLIQSSFKDSLRIVNFDAHKGSNLLRHICTLYAFPTEHIDFSAAHQNLGPSLSWMNILEDLRTSKKHIVGDNGFGYIFWDKYGLTTNTESFKFYDPESARLIYKRFGPVIGTLNKFLPPTEQLPTTTTQPRGYVTQWDRRMRKPEDMAQLLKAINELGLQPGEQKIALDLE